MHMYWDKEELTEEQVRIMNLYRMKIENKYTYINETLLFNYKETLVKQQRLLIS